MRETTIHLLYCVILKTCGEMAKEAVSGRDTLHGITVTVHKLKVKLKQRRI